MISVISVETAEHYVWGAACDGWHLVKGAALSVISERMPPHTSEVMHYHNKARQFFYVLRGALTFEMDGCIEVLTAHQGIEVPPRSAHQARNESNSEVEFLVISQPASHGDRVVVEHGEAHR
jgi:mannose-6-phosphate isomerase-like protein (cupin superfamily)